MKKFTNHTIFKFLSVLLVFQLATTRINAQTINESSTLYINKKYSALITVATDSIKNMMGAKLIPGLSVCVSVKGKVIWAQGFGYSDVENKIPVQLNTKFRVGSVSKTITAVALAKLFDQGKMHKDSFVTKYVPYWSPKKYNITIGQIGSHVAGIRHYTGREFISATPYSSVKESINIFNNDSLKYEPGSVHYYSSYGYNLLSAAIEGASGKEFLPFVQKEIFDPLGMKNSIADFNDSIIPNRTRFYDVRNKKIINATYVDNSNKWAGGGFLSTPYDLVKMGNALLTNKFISIASAKSLFTPYVLTSGKQNVYGIGFRIDKDDKGRTFMSHGGTSMGGRTYFIIYPTQQIVMAITYNYLPPVYNEIEISSIFADGLN